MDRCRARLELDTVYWARRKGFDSPGAGHQAVRHNQLVRLEDLAMHYSLAAAVGIAQPGTVGAAGVLQPGIDAADDIAPAEQVVV